jgi:hypothetical protein
MVVRGGFGQGVAKNKQKKEEEVFFEFPFFV